MYIFIRRSYSYSSYIIWWTIHQTNEQKKKKNQDKCSHLFLHITTWKINVICPHTHRRTQWISLARNLSFIRHFIGIPMRTNVVNEITISLLSCHHIDGLCSILQFSESINLEFHLSFSLSLLSFLLRSFRLLLFDCSSLSPLHIYREIYQNK